MSVFALKIIAVVSMLIDHTGFFLRCKFLLDAQPYTVMRMLGRIAFPIFCFLLANGFDKTSDRSRYLSRLVMFAVISRIPFSLTFSTANYSLSAADGFCFVYPWYWCLLLVVFVCFVWYRTVRPGLSFIWAGAAVLLALLNLSAGGVRLVGRDCDVFYTLAISLAAMSCLDRIMPGSAGRKKLILQLPALALCAALILPHSDYGWLGLLLILLLHMLRSHRPLQAAAIVAWAFAEYMLRMQSLQYFIPAALAALPILLYNGRPGRRVQLAFYLFYPLHLAILGLLTLLI